MLGDTTRRATYRDLADLSDSDEAEMDISDESGDEDANDQEPRSKRQRTTGPTTERPQDAPKWSNPDPYTALPPPDETTRKKTNMVQLIRKARVEAESKKPAASTEADFISCDISDDDGDSRQPEQLPPRPKQELPPRPSTQGQPPSTAGTQSNNDYQQQSQLRTPQGQGAPNNAVNLTASSSLGNRKRTFDDQIKMPHASLKPVRKMATSGNVVPDWRPIPGEDPCPWAEVDHSATVNMGTRYVTHSRYGPASYTMTRYT